MALALALSKLLIWSGLLDRKLCLVKSHASELFAEAILGMPTNRIGRIASTPGVLEGIVPLFSLEEPADSQHNAIIAFRALAQVRESRGRMLSAPGTIKNLVNLFSRTLSRRNQLLALEAFIYLICDPDNRSTMFSTPGVLSSLVDLTYRDLPPMLKIRAAEALLLLSLSGKEDLCIPAAMRTLRALRTNAFEKIAHYKALRLAKVVITHVAKRRRSRSCP